MILSEELPEKERDVLDELKALPHNTKMALMKIIRNTSKDGVFVCSEMDSHLEILLKQEIIIQNPVYKGKGYSFFVMSRAPYLLRKITRFYQARNDKKVII